MFFSEDAANALGDFINKSAFSLYLHRQWNVLTHFSTNIKADSCYSNE